jgi:hypothetical protein
VVRLHSCRCLTVGFLWGISRADAIAYATLVLAVTAVGAFVANALLAWYSYRSMTFFREQAAIFREQLRDDRDRAFPRLRARWPVQAGDDYSGVIYYVGGSEPALEVEVFLRIRAQYWHGNCETVYPSGREFLYLAKLSDNHTENSEGWASWPFKTGDERDAALAVVWRGSVGGKTFSGRRYRLDESRGYVEYGPLLEPESSRAARRPGWRLGRTSGSPERSA